MTKYCTKLQDTDLRTAKRTWVTHIRFHHGEGRPGSLTFLQMGPSINGALLF